MAHRDSREPRVRILAPIVVLASIILLGSVVIYALGRGTWSFGDAVYVTINAISTVGFRELDGMETVRFAHEYIRGERNDYTSRVITSDLKIAFSGATTIGALQSDHETHH